MSGEKNREITINDIARALNIAASTVSRALNNSDKISEATREKVWAVAREMGYEINLVASSLSKSKTNLIGIIVPHIESQFFSKAINAIQETVIKAGYNVIISQTYERYDLEVKAVRTMNALRVDGLMASLSIETQSVDHFGPLVKKMVPMALFDRVSYDLPGVKVLIDNFDAAYKATCHLAKTGCQRIAFLGGNPHCKLFRERGDGFKAALMEMGLALHPQFHLACDLSEKDIAEALKLWMSKADRPDGIVAATAAAGTVLAGLLKAYGLSIPDDVAIIAIGTEKCHEFMMPSLSAIAMPGEEIGRTAALGLLDMLGNGRIEDAIVVKPFHLLIRNSTYR